MPQLIQEKVSQSQFILRSATGYTLTEDGKQLLVKTGLWDKMEAMVKLHHFMPPGCILVEEPDPTKGYIIALGIQELVSIAIENKIPPDVLIGIVITGFEDLERHGEGELFEL